MGGLSYLIVVGCDSSIPTYWYHLFFVLTSHLNHLNSYIMLLFISFLVFSLPWLGLPTLATPSLYTPHPHPKVGYWITKVNNMDNNHIHFYKLPTNTKSNKTRNAILVNFTFNYIEAKKVHAFKSHKSWNPSPFPFLNSQFIFLHIQFTSYF